MAIDKKIEEVVAPSLAAEGLGVVKVGFNSKERKRALLQVFLERLDNTPLTVKDIEKASKMVSMQLDVADVIKDAYFLEVSSAGIDRPLVKPADYARFVGSKVKIETKMLIGNSRTLRGTITKTSKESVTIQAGNAEVEIAFSDIKNARLTVSDEIIREKLKQSKNKKGKKEE